MSEELLRSAFYARAEFGRINDLIHAAAIALALPHLLATGEVLKRPSLAAGNDPSRPFDVETDRRVAEFNLGDGMVMMRGESASSSRTSYTSPLRIWMGAWPSSTFSAPVPSGS